MWMLMFLLVNYGVPCLFVDVELLVCEVGGGTHADDDFDGAFFHVDICEVYRFKFYLFCGWV